MNSDEYYIGEDERAYVSPTVSRDEQFEFIDTLRDQIGKNNTLISTQTEQLGTDIQPSLGGLTGSEGYFQQRYQTTPVETQVNTLKATAQAKALNDLMTNYAEQAKNRYQQAYRSAQKRANTGGGDDTPDNTGLDISTDSGLDDETTEVDTTNWRASLGKINSTPEGRLYYLDASPTKNKTPIYIENLSPADDLTGTVIRLGKGYNGKIKTLNGKKYIYLDTGQFAPSWYRVGE